MLLKLGVDISYLKRPLRRVLPVIDEIYKQNGLGDAVITSTYDGNHSIASLHYAHLAIDVRRCSNYVRDKIKAELGTNFDVVLEADHLHIEYDPKGIE